MSGRRRPKAEVYWQAPLASGPLDALVRPRALRAKYAPFEGARRDYRSAELHLSDDRGNVQELRSHHVVASAFDRSQPIAHSTKLARHHPLAALLSRFGRQGSTAGRLLHLVCFVS